MNPFVGSPSEMVDVPFIPQPYLKAPKVDPYLEPESVRQHHVRFGEVEMPPILSGVQQGMDLHGTPRDYNVRVMWVNRKKIDEALRALEHDRPELHDALEIVRAFMVHLDDIRSTVKAYVVSARNGIKAGDMAYAQESLKTAAEVLGRWDDEHRLHLH